MQRLVSLVMVEAAAVVPELSFLGGHLLIIHVEVLEGIGDIEICFEDARAVDSGRAVVGRSLSVLELTLVILSELTWVATSNLNLIVLCNLAIGMCDMSLVVVCSLIMIIMSDLIWVVTSIVIFVVVSSLTLIMVLGVVLEVGCDCISSSLLCQ